MSRFADTHASEQQTMVELLADINEALKAMDEREITLAELQEARKFPRRTERDKPALAQALKQWRAGGSLLSRGETPEQMFGRGYEKARRPGRVGGDANWSEVLRGIKAAQRGDARAYDRMTQSEDVKALTGGELLVAEEMIPGYVEQRRADAPVRELVTKYEVDRREVHVLLEGNTVTVDWTPEGGTKPYSEGSVVEKVGLVFKPAGQTKIPDELDEDSNNLASEIVARQFASAIGRKIDAALLDGDGAGKPTGVLRATGVNRVTVADQTAVALYDAIHGAIARLEAKFTLATYVHLLADDLPEPEFFDYSTEANDDDEDDVRRRQLREDAAGRDHADVRAYPRARVAGDG